MRHSPAATLADALERGGLANVTEDVCTAALQDLEAAGFVIGKRVQLGPIAPRLTAGDKPTPSPAEIEAAKTPRGQWTRAQLAKWGVPWPPPSGWKRELEARWRASRSAPAFEEPELIPE